jgi:hypothetical protein
LRQQGTKRQDCHPYSFSHTYIFWLFFTKLAIFAGMAKHIQNLLTELSHFALHESPPIVNIYQIHTFSPHFPKSTKTRKKRTKTVSKGYTKLPSWKKIIIQLEKYFFSVRKKYFANWAFTANQLDSQGKTRCKNFLLRSFGLNVIEIRPHPASRSIENIRTYHMKRRAENIAFCNTIGIFDRIVQSNICLKRSSTSLAL